MTVRRADMAIARAKDRRGKLTAARARLLFDYDASTGIVTNKVRRGVYAQVGAQVGHAGAHGYLAVSVDRWPYLVHRLVWLIVHGDMPAFVDHKDGDRRNNRLDNLRIATRAENNCNTATRKDNLSGLKGVSMHKDTRRFYARISAHGQLHRLGSFDTAEEAHKAYAQAAQRLHGDFVRVPMALADIPPA